MYWMPSGHTGGAIGVATHFADTIIAVNIRTKDLEWNLVGREVGTNHNTHLVDEFKHTWE